MFFVLSLTGCERRQPLHEETRLLMGTYVKVSSADVRAGPIVFAEFSRLEKLFSVYDPQSEVSRLNRERKILAGEDLITVVRESMRFWEATDGAFDITVEPLVELWGFRTQEFGIPQQEDILRTAAAVGMDKIIMQPNDTMIQFIIPDVRIDPGGIVKGYALDRSVAKLKAAGISSCLINAGGQIYALGERSPGKPWRVAIRHPRLSGVLPETIELKDRSVATSGDYEQFFEREGKRYSHVIDPRTGRPAESALAGVTVIAPDGITADALSTAAFVLGESSFKKIKQKFPGVEILASKRE